MARITKRIKKTYIDPNHRGETFPRVAIAKAVANVSKGQKSGPPPFRVVAYGDEGAMAQPIRLLTETAFFLTAEDVYGAGSTMQAFDGWAFPTMEDAQKLFGILRRFGGVSCWIVEVNGDD